MTQAARALKLYFAQVYRAAGLPWTPEDDEVIERAFAQGPRMCVVQLSERDIKILLAGLVSLEREVDTPSLVQEITDLAEELRRYE